MSDLVCPIGVRVAMSKNGVMVSTLVQVHAHIQYGNEVAK